MNDLEHELHYLDVAIDRLSDGLSAVGDNERASILPQIERVSERLQTLLTANLKEPQHV